MAGDIDRRVSVHHSRRKRFSEDLSSISVASRWFCRLRLRSVMCKTRVSLTGAGIDEAARLPLVSRKILLGVIEDDSAPRELEPEGDMDEFAQTVANPSLVRRIDEQ